VVWALPPAPDLVPAAGGVETAPRCATMEVVSTEVDRRAHDDRSARDDALLPKACPSCRTRYSADALFCAFDGSPLATTPAAIAAAAATDPYIGHEIVGSIEIRQLVGIGAMGRVYRGFQKGIDRDVAVKILHRELSANPTVVARFHREARVASRLAHPNVVHVLLTGQLPDGAMYIVMEYLDGMSLQSALAASGGGMPLARALHVALGVCDAAGEAHAQGIVHRDLKPENVMLVRRGHDSDFVKVLDFGIARLNWGDQSMATAQGLIFGTARYISPEGAQGEKVGPPGDVYSIATMLYQMLGGRTPFDAEQAVALLVHQIHDPPPPLKSIARASLVPEAIAAQVMKNLAKKPEDRAQDAREFGRALLQAASMQRARRHEQLESVEAPRLDATVPQTAFDTPASSSHAERAPVPTEIGEEPAEVPARRFLPSPSGVAATMAEQQQPPPSSSSIQTRAGDGPGVEPVARGRTLMVVALCFVLGAAGMAGVASKTDLLGARHAPAPQLEALVSHANAALLHQRWDSPKGDNVRDVTDEGLSRSPNDPQLLRIRTLACGDIVKAARAKRDEGNVVDALRLAKLAYELDPSDDLAQKLFAELESQAQSPLSDSVPPLASVRPPTGVASASAAARATLDASNPTPGAGESVDFTARVVGGSGTVRTKVDGATFRVSGPGIGAGTQLDAVEDGSGIFRTTFTFSQAGRFEVTFGARADGAPVRTVRAVQVAGVGPTKTPLPAANGEPAPAPPSSAKWL
jgi:serine/threonine protein kinase